MIKRRAIFKGFVLMGMIVFLLPSVCLSSDDQAEDLFPEMEGWELNVGDKFYTPDNLWDIINGAADSYLSYDFQKLYTARYSNNQDGQMRVYIFEHSTPTNTFGIYSQERSSDYEFVNTGAQGFKSSESYYFITGPYYVQINANEADLSDSMEELAQRMDEEHSGKGKLPAELNLFPKKGKLKNSEKYIANNFLGYSYLHSAFIADYEQGGESFQIFLISPENKQETEEILNKYLDFVEFPEDKRDKNQYSIEDPYNGSILLYKSGKYLCGIMGTDENTKEQYLGMLKDQLE
ncbi:MAG: DUF6599 family protein [Bacteroidales bacterium]|nr:hypothetical protein [Bacteroidales bacterium]